jgi:hypothetical protein
MSLDDLHFMLLNVDQVAKVNLSGYQVPNRILQTGQKGCEVRVETLHPSAGTPHSSRRLREVVTRDQV